MGQIHPVMGKKSCQIIATDYWLKNGFGNNNLQKLICHKSNQLNKICTYTKLN